MKTTCENEEDKLYGEPEPNGISCPDCGTELMDTNPMERTLRPSVHCPDCGFSAYRRL